MRETGHRETRIGLNFLQDLNVSFIQPRHSGNLIVGAGGIQPSFWFHSGSVSFKPLVIFITLRHSVSNADAKRTNGSDLRTLQYVQLGKSRLTQIPVNLNPGLFQEANAQGNASGWVQ